MIGEALRAQVAAYAASVPANNPLFVKAEMGALNARHISRYLASVHFLVRHTPIHLDRARKRAAELGDAALDDHFAKKSVDEAGHDLWAARDLERIREQLSAAEAQPDVARSMKDYVRHIEDVIDEDPVLYLAYILFAEYLVVIVGPSWLALLEERCGIPRTSMTVVGNHAELDREHVEEALEEIDDLVGDPRKLAPMRRVVTRTIALFDAFCAEVTSDRRASRHAQPHVSAA